MQLGLSTPKPVFSDHPEPSWKRALRQENSGTICHIPRLLRGLGLCSSFGRGAGEVVRLLTGVDFQGQENLSGFLAFFLKTLRNPVQAAPVGHR